MPGIVGIITKLPRTAAEPKLLSMVESMRHEPFYTAGTWIDESLGVYAGWVAREGSFSDGMPLRSRDGELTLLFSGEDFSEPEKQSRLRQSGDAADAAGPSHLVPMAEGSPDFPAELNGRFQGLLIRHSIGEALLFNDRYGMQRLYIYQSRDSFYFAAEAKAILAVCPELREIDQQSLGEFIACGCTLEDRTLFKGLSLLPPASAWTFRDAAQCCKRQYFNSREWEEQTPLGEEEFYERLRDVFPRILARYFSEREKIGMSLTGGLDSRMILSWRHPAPRSLPFYSFGSIYRDSQDVKMARRIARECGQDFQVIPVAEEFLSNFSRYAERTVYLTDGSLEVKRAPELYINERARAVAPVRLSGDYGGEVLRQTLAFKPVDFEPGLFHSDIESSMRQAHATYGQIAAGHPMSFSVFRQAPWYLYSGLGLEQTQIELRTPFLDNDLVRLVYRAPQKSLTGSAVCLRLIADGDPALRRLRTDRGLGGQLPRFLSQAQQAFLNFTFKAEYAYDYGMPQAVARLDHALSRLHLERAFLGRHKFYHFRVWYRDALAGYVRQILLDSRALSRSYVQPGALERVVGGHLKGAHNCTTELHKLLTLELLHRLFIDRN
jgi:asparagine synthase (glutamine-hydrolysing)